MQRYFATFDKFKNIVLYEDDIFHITKVMRMKISDNFEINADGILYLAKVSSINPFKFEIIKEIEENHELSGYIRLLYCLPKGDKVDFVIQKSVELGVSEVVLINSSRSIKKITNDKKEEKIKRYQKIIKEASEQSKRDKLMILNDVITFNEIHNYKGDINLIAYENSKNTIEDLKNILSSIKGKKINIIVGCEGGITKEELNIAKNNKYIDITLGNRILRSETACLYILSLISFYME